MNDCKMCAFKDTEACETCDKVTGLCYLYDADQECNHEIHTSLGEAYCIHCGGWNAF